MEESEITLSNIQTDDQPQIPSNWLANFLPMFIGQVLSLLGSSLVMFALVWYATKQTGDATVLATATTIAHIPYILIGPFVGAMVDRWNRKLVMIFSDLIVALATAVLALLFAFNLIQIWHIYLILFIRSLAGVFQSPAQSASISLMVPKEQLTRLGGINQATHGLINTFSPALGALLMELLPIQGVLAIDTITAAIAILLLIFFVKVPQPKTDSQKEMVTVKSLLADVRFGFRYILGWRGLAIIILIASLLNMVIAPAGNLLPLLITEFFQKGAQELAWMQVAMGAGSIAGGLILGVWGGFKRQVVNILLGIVGIGAGVLFLGFLPNSAYWIALGAFGFIGLSSSLANGALGPLLQTKVPPEVQGRVFTVLSSLSIAIMPIGLYLSAPIAKQFGIQTAYIVGGALGLLLVVYAALNRHVMTFDRQSPGGIIEEDPQA